MVILVPFIIIFIIFTYIYRLKFNKMPYSSLYMSGEILTRAKEQGEGISNMKLQKLLYIANGLYLAKNGTPLIEEPIKAWTYGPVIENVYHEYKQYGNENITKIPWEYQLNNSKIKLDNNVNEVVDFVLEVAKKLSAIQLSNWTHAEKSPWSKAKLQGNTIISEKDIKDFFVQFLPKENIADDTISIDTPDNPEITNSTL